MAKANGANHLGAYIIAVLVAAVFGALQGVQDKLDDPFDGMSEDDINLDTIDEWTFNSLQNAANRDFVEIVDIHGDDINKPPSRKGSLLPLLKASLSKDKLSEQEPSQSESGSAISQTPKQINNQSIAELIHAINLKDNKKKKNPFRRIGSKAIKHQKKESAGKGGSASETELTDVTETMPLTDIKLTTSSPPKSPSEKSVTFEDEHLNVPSQNDTPKEARDESASYYNDLGTEKPQQDGREAEEQPLLSNSNDGARGKGTGSDDSFQVVVM